MINDSLSSRENEIANLVAGGFSNAEIAERLFVTEKTIKFHLTSIYEKLGVKSRAQVIVQRLSEGVTTDEIADFRKLF